MKKRIEKKKLPEILKTEFDEDYIEVLDRKGKPLLITSTKTATKQQLFHKWAGIFLVNSEQKYYIVRRKQIL